MVHSQAVENIERYAMSVFIHVHFHNFQIFCSSKEEAGIIEQPNTTPAIKPSVTVDLTLDNVKDAVR